MAQRVQATILLVDDDAARAASAATALRASLPGYAIATVGSREAGLRLTNGQDNGTYACVVLRDRLTGVAGEALIAKIRRHNPRVPVIRATGGPGIRAIDGSDPGTGQADPPAAEHVPPPTHLANRITRAIHQARNDDRSALPEDPGSPADLSRGRLALQAEAGYEIKQAVNGAPDCSDMQDGALTSATAMAMVRAICEKDHATGAHCMWVGWLAAEIGRGFGLNEEQTERIRTAGILHDLGKIGVPKTVLLKPGPLTKEERHLVDRHARIGADLVARHRGGPQIQQAIRCHHDWFDGSRAVSGRRGHRPPVYARILAAADAYQSMVEERPYRATRRPSAAIDELRRFAGTQFDPTIVEVLADIMATLGDEGFPAQRASAGGSGTAAIHAAGVSANAD